MSYRIALSALFFLASAAVARGQSAQEVIGKLYVAQQLDAAIAQGEQELKAHGEQPAVSMVVGRAYADKQQFQEAIPYLSLSLASAAAPADVKAWSQAYLGTCYYSLQQYGKARQAFEAVVDGAATKNVVAYAGKRLGLARAAELAESWPALETAHFRFHFQASQPANTLQAFAATREQAYESHNRFFRATLPRKIDFFVWEYRQQAAKVLGEELGFTRPSEVTIHIEQNQTKGHELAHMLTFYGLSPTHTSKLINEGVAVCFDLTSRNRLQEARRAAAGPVDVWRMWAQPQGYSTQQVYAVGGALLEYLLAHGPEADVKELLRDQTPETGRRLFSKQIADFEKELNKPDSRAVAVSPSLPASAGVAAAGPVKLDAAQVNAVVERSNAAHKFYKVLILLNGKPVSAALLETVDAHKIQDMKVLKKKEEMQAYTEVELNGIVLITVGS